MNGYRSRRRRFLNNRRQNRAVYRAAFEPMEERRLMSLLGVVPGWPQIISNQTGTVNYTYTSSTATGTFDMSSNPMTFQAAQGGASHAILGPSSYTIQFQTDGNGNVVGGVVGADLSISGTIDMNNDLKNDAGDISGVLLQGEISQFGYLNSGTTDQYDFIFTPDSNSLLVQDYPAQFAGQDIGVTLTSANSTFNGNFMQNFSGKAKSTVGPVPAPVNAPPTGSIAGTKFQDLTGNGFSADDTPLAGVVINLYQDTDNNGVLDAGDTYIGSQTTDTNGNYIFGGLSAGTYFADETVPAGQTETGTPTVWTVSLAANQAATGVNFDDFINVNISGTKYHDLTGNSFSADDPGLSGVTIDLYQNGSSTPLEQTTTDNSGNYSFNNLGPGSYFVQEEVPTGWIETGGNSGYTIDATSGSNYTGNNFDDYQIVSPLLVTTASNSGSSYTVDSAVPQDTAVLSGGLNETGNLVFTLTAPDGSTAYSQTIASNGNGTYTTTNTDVASQVGTYTWHVQFQGDPLNYSASDQGGALEQITTVQATPSIITYQQPVQAVVGSSIADEAVVSGGDNPTGTVTFNLYNNPGGVGPALFTDSNEPLVNGTATSIGYTAAATGTDYWVATYNGDADNASVTSGTADEPVMITQAIPSLTTQASQTGTVVGSAMLSDIATLSGAYAPGGTISFTLTLPDGSTVNEGSDNVSGDGNYNSPSVLATEAGAYIWQATYSGDSNNLMASDDGANEGLVIAPASPVINTQATASNGGVVGSAMLSDQAVLSGGYMPSGTIYFSLTAPDGTTTQEGSVPVTGDNTYYSPTSVLATEVGTYTWHASYSGDSNNNGAMDNGANEGVVTTQASPTISTVANEAGNVVGTAQSYDTATLSGGYAPGGTITFSLMQPDGSIANFTAIPVTGDGVYNSPIITATQVGNYTWHAVYSGDTGNNSASDNGVNESFSTTKASPVITTQASEIGSIVGNAILSDQATLAGGYMPGGIITFSVTAPDGNTTTLGTVNVSGDGSYNSPTVLATEVGNYTFHAVYSGDINNNGATDNGLNEGVATTQASPAITTQASETAGGVVGSAVLTDQATLSGGYNPGGTITFSLTQPDNNTIVVGTVTANGDGVYNSPSVLATEVGTYTWHATYSGDANNTPATDNGANEGVVTTKASPTITTQAAQTTGIVGSSMISDTATIAGGYNVSGGSITFSLTAPDGSTTVIGSVPVSGPGTYDSTSILATEVGTYTFHASYSGDGLNNGAIDNGINEAVTTTQASPAITTQASETAGGVVGSSQLTDVATLSGGYNPSGTIAFTLTQPDGSAISEGSVAVNGDGSYDSPSVLATEVGNYTWHATYSGDTNNVGASDNGANEGVTTTKASPAINTVGNETNGNAVGTATLSDTATLSGGYNVAGGTITFTVTAPDGTTTTVGTSNVTGDGSYSSPSFVATEVGTYTFHAVYSGNGLNLSASDNGVNESVTTVQSSPAITTQASETGSVVGSASLSDKATLSGGYLPTGTITFTLTKPDGTTITVGTANVSGDGVYSSPSVTATEVGNYTFHATYSGDTNNSGASDNGANEGVSTVKASPTVVTSASFKTSTTTVGAAIPEDSATVSGGYLPGGSITFTLKNPSGTTIDTQTVTVSGDGSYSTTNTTIATAVGTYTWTAVYSGDANNNTANDQGGSAEQVITTKASPTITTTASKSGTGMCGSSTTVTDSAVVASGYNPTGTITFTLTGPAGATISTQTVNINGDGTYTPTAVATTTAGTYTWHATYNGDADNNGANDQGGTAEQVTIGKNAPTVTTTASTKSGTGNAVGTAIPEDSAVIAGGYNPTGSITFTLKNSTGTTIDTQTVTVTGDGTYNTTNTIAAPAVGTYTWTAVYSGDSNNGSANDQGGSAEQVTITKASPTIVTTASLKTGCTNFVGNGIPEDSAVLSGGYSETGSLTFTLVAPNGSTVDTQVITVKGNGTYTTTNTAVATQTGTYTWHVTYAGDTNNNTAVDQGGSAEQITITAGSISGTKYNDVTGNGLSDDDTPITTGVTIELLNSSGKVIATQVTDGSGNYDFTGLAAGTYTVEECVPTGWVQTAPVSGQYTITISSSNTTSTGNDFDDFMSSCCNTADFTCVSFCIQDASGVKTVSDLRGNTNQGDEVTAYFDYTGTSPHPVTFVTYTAPDNYWNPNDASEQQIFQSVTIMAQPGENSITVQIPNCDYQIDLVCGYAIDQLGPAGSNITYSSQDRLISADNDGTEAQTNCFGQVNGTVYLDLNNNGQQDSNEVGIAGVTVELTGKDQNGDAVSLLRLTDSNGDYSFQGLQPGTYSVKEITPAGYTDGKDTLGTGAGGTMSNDLFSNLKIVCGTDGENYNFGELPGKACSGVSGCTATCTFWNGTSGKNLLCSFGSGSSDCSLGNWLASCYPNLYGSSCGSNCLAGKSNAAIYTYFQTLYKTSSSKTACEVLAACLNIYATDASLGGLCGAAYGFNVQCDGSSCTTYSVGSNGSCFGVSNNTKCSLSELVAACNSKSSKGSLFGGNSSNSNSCYTVLSGINGW